MTPDLSITIAPQAQALINRMSDTAGLMKALAKAVDRENQFTVGHIRSVRMRGNNGKPFPVSDHVLGIRDAHYFRQLRATEARIEGERIVSSIGANVKYAAIHEFGGTIKRVLLAGSVRLRTDKRGNLLRQGKNGNLAVFAKRRHKLAQTVSFAGGKRYEVRIPARAPVTHGIRDRLPAIGAGLSLAIFEFYKGGKQ